MAANKEDTLRQFCDVTGADENRSRFFLESSNWQLEVALSSFYEHGGNVEEAPSNPTAAPIPMSDSDDSPPTSPARPQKKEKKKAPPSKFATLDSLRQESSSEEEEGQAFYAGGSERSGQQILGPGKGRKDIITEMFKSVRERGAVEFDEPTSTSRGRGAFSGVGYRLGQPDDQETSAPVTRSSSQVNQEPRRVALRLYREGFTVDDGPLRRYTDEENNDFLACIRRGEIPAELSDGSRKVCISLEDRCQAAGPPAAPTTRAFAGKGHMLGSPTPATVGATAPVAAAAADRDANQRAAQTALNVDDAQPVTTVQFRLADGSRITGRFNHTHTVADLVSFVTRAEPTYQLYAFALLTTYPSAELTDMSATLAQANLLNTTLLQRIK